MRKLNLVLLALLVSFNLAYQQVSAVHFPAPELNENDPIVIKAKETFEIAKKAAYEDAVARGKVDAAKARLAQLERDHLEKMGFDRSYEEREIPLVKESIRQLEEARKPLHEKALALQKIADEARAYTFVAFYDTAKRTLVPGTKIELHKSEEIDTLDFVRKKLGDELASKYYLARSQSHYLVLPYDFESVTVIELTPRASLKRGQVAPTGEARLWRQLTGVGLLCVLVAFLTAFRRENTNLA